MRVRTNKIKYVYIHRSNIKKNVFIGHENLLFLLVSKSLAHLSDAIFRIDDNYSFLLLNVTLPRLSRNLELFEFRVCSLTFNLQVYHKTSLGLSLCACFFQSKATALPVVVDMSANSLIRDSRFSLIRKGIYYQTDIQKCVEENQTPIASNL